MVPLAIARMLFARLVAMLVALAGMATLARLLSPTDFGTFALAMAVFGVLRAISEFGLMSYLVRRDALEVDELSSAAGLALSLALTLWVLAALVVWVIGTLVPPTIVLPAGTGALVGLLGAALVAEAVALPYEAQRRHAIDFALLSRLVPGQAIADVGVAVALGFWGVGAAALAAGVLASRVVGALLLVLACPPRERPVPRCAGWYRFVRFGSGFAAARLLPRLGDLAIVGLLGHALGVASVGVYNRAGAVHAILDRTLFEAINPVLLPALGRSLRAGVVPRLLYTHKIDYLVCICWPAFACIALLSEPLVGVLLGPRWEAAAAPVRILALAGLCVPFTKMSMKLFVAMNRVDLHLRIQIVATLGSVVGVAAGSLHSLEGACTGLVLAEGLRVALVRRGIARASGESPRVPAKMLLRGLAVTVASVAGPLIVSALWPEGGDAVRLAVAVVLAGLGWAGSMLVMRHPLCEDALVLVRDAVASRRARDG